MAAPAPVCTNTEWPCEVSSRTLAGVRPTRYSWFLISLGSPTRMLFSRRFVMEERSVSQGLRQENIHQSFRRVIPVSNNAAGLFAPSGPVQLVCLTALPWAALATASAVMFTMRRTVAEGLRTCTEEAAPSRMGPTVTPCPLVILSTLKRMLAASRFGQISTLASPLSLLSIRAVRRMSSDKAASPCSSPSHSTSGAIWQNSSCARRILTADLRLDEPY